MAMFVSSASFTAFILLLSTVFSTGCGGPQPDTEKSEQPRVTNAGFVCLEKVYNSELMAPCDIFQHHKIEITFRKEGGGEDYRDIFIYWIHQKRNTMDYLSYQFFTDGGGMRFREACNHRTINGIRFADYRNYKPQSGRFELADYDRLFESGKLQEISQIILENISVKLHN